jgi:uncharacterized protein YkwD
MLVWKAIWICGSCFSTPSRDSFVWQDLHMTERPARRRPAALALVLALVTCGPPAQLSGRPSDDELEVVRLVNASRAEHGLPALEVEPGLMPLAREHARRMARRLDIFHAGRNPEAGRLAGAWPRFAENVGVAATPADVHAAFMRSPNHRRNVLGPFTHIGVGVVEGHDGRVYAMEIFVGE